MSTQNSDFTSAPDQRARAQEAHLNPNDPAKDAEAGTPAYGDFGKPNDDPTPGVSTNTLEGRSGANDNPDEFSALRNEAEARAHPDNPQDQPGHVNQNQDTAAVAAAEAAGADTDELRAAWSKDDPRYAGGGSHNAYTGATPEVAERNAGAANKSADNPA